MLSGLLIDCVKNLIRRQREAVVRLEAHQLRATAERRAEEFDVEPENAAAFPVENAIIRIASPLPQIYKLELDVLAHFGAVDVLERDLGGLSEHQAAENRSRPPEVVFKKVTRPQTDDVVFGLRTFI